MTVHLKHPSFVDFFKSNFYENTYVAPVDIEKSVPKVKACHEAIVKEAKKLLSDEGVQHALGDRFVYRREGIEKRNAVLEKKGFSLLGSKLVERVEHPFYSVSEHPSLKGWVIKGCGKRVPDDITFMGPINDKDEMCSYTEEEGLFRVAMRKRIKKEARLVGLEVALPKKYLIAMNSEKDPTKKYALIAQKLELCSREETENQIRQQAPEKQRELASKMCALVKRVGLVDATFNNIRYTKDGKLAFFDTEPGGLMKRTSFRQSVFRLLGISRRASVEKCARVGLFQLQSSCQEISILNFIFSAPAKKGSHVFEEEVSREYKASFPPKLSSRKIAISVASLGIYPLILAVTTAIRLALFQVVFWRVQKIDRAFHNKGNVSVEAQIAHYQQRSFYGRAILFLAEGVPHLVV